MSDSIEPSYYEIALTNRQVVIAFVILLTLVLAIFLCGVWVGKNGQERLAREGYDSTPVTAPAAEEKDQLANLEEFKFFNGEGGESPEAAQRNTPEEQLDRPDLSVLNRPEPTTLAQAVGSEDAGRPAPAPETGQGDTAPEPEVEAPEPAPRQATPPPTATPEPRPTRSTPPAAEAPAPAVTEGFVVQVFSTRDEPQARKVLAQLKQSGHKAFLSAVEVTGQTMYRVRVGPFAERPAAEQVAGQVRRQMKLDPWVTAAGN